MSYWRSKAAVIIRDILELSQGKPDAEVRKALHDAYPFGERRYHPYKVWLDEVKRQSGQKLMTPKQVEAAEKKKKAYKKLEEWNRLFPKVIQP